MTAIVEPAYSGTRAALRNAIPLLVGVALLMAGNGLSSTLLGTRGGLEGFSPTVVGVVLSGYYVGFVGGSLAAPATIARVGHVRVFAGLASLGSGALLIHLVTPDAASWFMLRAVSGLCIAGLFVVTETWLNGAATNESRGALLSAYMVVVGASVFAGQMLYAATDPAGVGAFVLASVLVSLAVVPVSLATFDAPSLPESGGLHWGALWQTAPLAPVGAVISGFVVSGMLGAGVVYASVAGLNRLVTAAFIGAALLGGVALQVPLGRWSDRVDRRLVMVAAGTAGATASFLVAAIGPSHRLVIIALTTVAGGATFSVYSLSLAHLNDYLEDHLTVAGGGRMVMLQGVGAVAGPVIGSALVGRIGPGALFVAMGVAYSVVAGFAVVRIGVRDPADVEDRAEFAPVSVGGATVSSLEADLDDWYPASGGFVESDDLTLGYQERGDPERDAVVLLGTPVGRDVEWRNVLGALAYDGYRAITAWTADDPGRALTAEDVLALLRHLELPWASYVGAGRSAQAVATMAVEHPDRTDGTLVVSELDESHPLHAVTSPGEAPVVPQLAVDPGLWDNPESLADRIAESFRRR
ncbi:MAG: MFS transporter [Microthrixaceae bacterium]|nr:MFS transporter [Microthrixaceae bacterium]